MIGSLAGCLSTGPKSKNGGSLFFGYVRADRGPSFAKAEKQERR
jgi:hypothetical protein